MASEFKAVEDALGGSGDNSSKMLVGRTAGAGRA